MGNHPPRERPRLALATDAAVAEPGERRPVVTAKARDTPWPRGTILPPVDTPEGRQSLCFGTADELRSLAAQWRRGVAINSARTLWVVTVRG
jgi:hypothetical protein